MSGKNRPERVAQLLHECLAGLTVRGLKDPRLHKVTFTGAKVAADLRAARVYWTVHGDEALRAQTAQGLEAAKGWLRREASQTLGLRHAPELTFTFDKSFDEGDKIERLLREVKKADGDREPK